MPRFMLDTSCMVAAVLTWHVHHEPAKRAIEQRMMNGDEFITAGPALVETYAVLTRLPHPHRLSPESAREVLRMSFLAIARETVALTADAYSQLITSAPEKQITGGSIYDAVIATCGVAAGVTAILTFNERHFRLVGTQGIDIVVPE